MFSYTGIVLITAILLSLLPTVRTVPDLSQQEWIRLDEDLQLLHHDLGTGGKLPHHAANEYSDFLLKIRKERDRTAKVKKHEDLYRKNFFKFAKQATNGTIDNPIQLLDLPIPGRQPTYTTLLNILTLYQLIQSNYFGSQKLHLLP